MVLGIIAFLSQLIPVLAHNNLVAHFPWACLPWLGMLLVLAADALKRNFGRTISYGAGLIISYVVLILCLLFGPIVADYAQRQSFQPMLWKTAIQTDTDNPIKIRMVDDLLRRFKLIGMTQKQIDELLGKPPHTEYFSEYDYVYWLGPERSLFSIDSEWLCLKFKNGVVVQADMRRD